VKLMGTEEWMDVIGEEKLVDFEFRIGFDS
jgi:hypothetical protein